MESAAATGSPPLSRNSVLSTRKWQILIVAVCLAVLAVGTVRQLIPQTEYLIAYDFQHDREAALALRHGENPYAEAIDWLESYTPGSDLKSYYVYAPPLGLLFIPLTFVPLQTAIIVWGACNLSFLFLTVYALARAAGWRPSIVAT